MVAWKQFVILLSTLTLAGIAVATEPGVIEPESQLIGCDRADTQVTIDASARLDPSCIWTRGFKLTAADVLFDCQGAHIVSANRRYGILITAPADTALSNITVRNCHVEGFLNNLRVTRAGFRRLAEGLEYDHAYANIVIENSTFLNSRGVGVFIDGYVTGVTLRNLHIEGSGSAGVYLEAGSKNNSIEHNRIINNGYRQNGPHGQFFRVAGLSFWFWGTGREGLAIDGSRNNRIVDNYFTGNSAGSIFLYKNCGEFEQQRPRRWFPRRYGANGNLIEGNIFTEEDIGVWIASRMSENTLFMDCSDASYLPGFVLDYARDNIVWANEFRNVTDGIRVEDDSNTVAENKFFGDDAAQQAVLIGTRFRNLVLRKPVASTTINGNQSFITGNNHPYRWVYGERNTQYDANKSFDRTVGYCQGDKLHRNKFLFVVDFELANPDDPPSREPPVPDLPKPFPPCP